MVIQLLFNKKKSKLGLPPGTLVHIGDKKEDQVKITIFDYDEDNFEEIKAKNIEDCFPYRDKNTVSWINIDGLHNIELIEKIGNHFSLHSLLLEDILNTQQRPKIEEYENNLFIVVKMFYFNSKKNKIISEQISTILGHNYVITFQECVGDVFDSLRDRIRNKRGKIRKNGVDYLIYALLDIIVDNYFVILEKIGEIIEDMEDELIDDPSPKKLQSIYNIRKDLIKLRRSIWPLREIINSFSKSYSKFLKDSTEMYVRDVYDLSSVSNKMNEIMKVLTIIGTIFIPLTFVAGIYGMNFENMPELSLKLGYPLILIMMSIIGMIMILYFKKKEWI